MEINSASSDWCQMKIPMPHHPQETVSGLGNEEKCHAELVSASNKIKPS